MPIHSEGKKLVLLVEDNEDDVFFMRRAFSDAAISSALFVVEDGQQAIDYLSGTGKFSDREQFPLPSLILLDLKLPKVMGIDVLKWLRTNPALPPIPVVILTSSLEEPDVDRAYRQGANSYLVKPPNADGLLRLAKSIGEYWFDWNTPPRV